MSEFEPRHDSKTVRFCTLTDTDCSLVDCDAYCHGFFVAESLELLSLEQLDLEKAAKTAEGLIRPLDGETRRAVFKYLAEKMDLEPYKDFFRNLE